MNYLPQHLEVGICQIVVSAAFLHALYEACSTLHVDEVSFFACPRHNRAHIGDSKRTLTCMEALHRKLGSALPD